jgi:hypothetical protein
MKHILEQYKDNELPEQVKKKLEKADTFKTCLEIHSVIMDLKNTIEKYPIGIKIRGQK